MNETSLVMENYQLPVTRVFQKKTQVVTDSIPSRDTIRETIILNIYNSQLHWQKHRKRRFAHHTFNFYLTFMFINNLLDNIQS